MTAQFTEILRHEGREVSLCTQPLDDYFELAGIKPAFKCTSTALWRGYVGTWEILDGRLYLIKLRGRQQDGTEASLSKIFPGYLDRVFAHWYCGKMRSPQGNPLVHGRGVYSTTYERDLFITVRNGLVTNTQITHNKIDASRIPATECGNHSSEMTPALAAIIDRESD